jgi:hypothetical protein
MSNEIFDYSVAVFARGLGILAELLRKAESCRGRRRVE